MILDVANSIGDTPKPSDSTSSYKGYIGSLFLGFFCVYFSLNGLINGETAGIGSYNGPLRRINPEEDFYEFWFVIISLFSFGVLAIKRSVSRLANKK